jgi:hypothetical protein
MYCVHQETSRNVLLARLKSNNAFGSYAKEAQRHERYDWFRMRWYVRKNHIVLKHSARNLDLEAFLIKPVQRICKYPLLTRELLKVTPDDHPDFEALTRAHDVLEAIAEHVVRPLSLSPSLSPSHIDTCSPPNNHL